MSTAAQIRDWTYVAVIVLLLVSYGASLLSQGFTARAANDSDIRVCALPSSTQTN